MARTELLEAITVEAAVELRASRPILDCGCGTGWLLEALATSGVSPSRLWGVDMELERISAARARVPGAHIELGHAQALDHPDATFGVVMFIVSLSSMGSRLAATAALREGRRVLAPGGVMLCYEPRYPNPLNRETRLVRSSELAKAGVPPSRARTLTLMPPLGRRLGRATPRLHPLLNRLRPLRTHRLYVYCAAGASPAAEPRG